VTPRRWWAAALAGAAALSAQDVLHAQVPAWSVQAQQRLLAGPDAAHTLAEQQRLVQHAETQLAAGASEAAQDAFDRAAMMVHSADVEIGLVRTYLQAGDYRRALTFASHAAGAHRNVPAGTALYAWLLQIGGQGVYARRLVDDALALAPFDAALLAVQAQIGSDWPHPDAALLQAPLRAAPYATGATPPANTRVAGTAVLAGDGATALAPAALLPAAGRLWVRNGLGQTVAATVAQPAGDARLVVLHLTTALPLPESLAASVATSTSEPFAGSPGTTVEYRFGDGAAPAWPLLRQGFFGRGLEVPSAGSLAAPPGRLLGITAPPGPRGGPVFDAFGRIAGVALPHADGRDRLVPVQNLAPDLRWPAASSARAAERPGLDSVYATALHLALQLLVAD